jgi:transposase InsO family protein
VPDLIGRDFTTTEVNTKYVGDIVCLPLSGGTFRYLATVIILASRRLAGWAIADHMRADLVIDAPHAAERTRDDLTGAVHHSDHGAQYCSRAFADACREPLPTPHPHHRVVIHVHGAPGRHSAEGPRP